MKQKNERDAMLSSPIILYDYPKIAPESAGDLFDGTEIDEILTLRVQTMTDEEKARCAASMKQARRILERTENLSGERFAQDARRDARRANRRTKISSIQRSGCKASRCSGVELKAGDRVRIRPKKRADVLDIALAGKIAIIEAVEEDVENEVHFALVLEDDPGRDSA